MLRLKWCALLVVTVTLVGCFDSEPDIRTFVAEFKKTAKGNVKPLPAEKVYRSEEYDGKDLNSPFERNINATGMGVDGDGQQPRPDAARKREFLEKYPLEDFTMVGTLNKENYRWGLVQDKSGLVYPVQVGQYIGQNSGRIVAITADQISISEIVEDGYGGWLQKGNQLLLKGQN